jgi:hypothetical protein
MEREMFSLELGENFGVPQNFGAKEFIPRQLQHKAVSIVSSDVFSFQDT